MHAIRANLMRYQYGKDVMNVSLVPRDKLKHLDKIRDREIRRVSSYRRKPQLR